MYIYIQIWCIRYSYLYFWFIWIAYQFTRMIQLSHKCTSFNNWQKPSKFSEWFRSAVGCSGEPTPTGLPVFERRVLVVAIWLIQFKNIFICLHWPSSKQKQWKHIKTYISCNRVTMYKCIKKYHQQFPRVFRTRCALETTLFFRLQGPFGAPGGFDPSGFPSKFCRPKK